MFNNHKNIELKSPGTSKHTTTEENKETVDKKGSEQATFEEQLGEMLEEIDNLDFENDDDGFPSELK